MRTPDDLERFCAAEYPKLVRGMSIYLQDRAEAEDIAQEALSRACVRWDRVRGLDSPEGWVRRVAMNLGTSVWRRRRVESRVRQQLGAGSSDPQASVESVGAYADLLAAVAGLPHRQRAALAFRFYLDLPVRQVAHRMRVSEDAVRSLTKRAIHTLRTDLALEVDHE